MRTLKKIFALAVVLAFVLTVSVSADTQVYRYTGNGTSGHTYNGVKFFYLDLEDEE